MSRNVFSDPWVNPNTTTDTMFQHPDLDPNPVVGPTVEEALAYFLEETGYRPPEDPAIKPKTYGDATLQVDGCLEVAELPY